MNNKQNKIQENTISNLIRFKNLIKCNKIENVNEYFNYFKRKYKQECLVTTISCLYDLKIIEKYSEKVIHFYYKKILEGSYSCFLAQLDPYQHAEFCFYVDHDSLLSICVVTIHSFSDFEYFTTFYEENKKFKLEFKMPNNKGMSESMI